MAWKWKLSLLQKVGISLLSLLSVLCITTAFLRAVVGRDIADTSNLPTTSWLALWSIVEAAIAVIIGCCPGLYTPIRLLLAAPKNSARSKTFNNRHRRFDSRGYEKQVTNNDDSVVSMDEIVFGASRGHSRITSVNGEIVGDSRSQSRTTTLNPDGSRAKHIPIQLPSTYGHTKNTSGSLSTDFWKEVDPPIQRDTLGPLSTPGVSKRNSKTSLKYTPIQIPGTVGHKRDRAGSLSGAFWGEMNEEMDDGERGEVGGEGEGD